MSDLRAVADAAGAGFEAIRPMVETASRCAEGLLGEPMKVAGDMLADQIYGWQVINRVKILTRVKRLLNESGIPESVVPPGFLVPALQECGNADSDELQDIWSRLIAAAVVDSTKAQILYVATVKQLSSHDAKVLAALPRQRAYRTQSGTIVGGFYAGSLSFEDREALPRLEAVGLVEQTPVNLMVRVDLNDMRGSVLNAPVRSQEINAAALLHLTEFAIQLLRVIDPASDLWVYQSPE